MAWYYNFSSGIGIYGWIFIVLFFLAVIWLVIWLLRMHKTSQEHLSEEEYRERTKALLKKKYSDGEITKNQYEKLKKKI